MKQCAMCLREKKVSEFSFKNRIRNLKNSYCTECNKSYQKAHYVANHSDYRLKRNSRRTFVKAEHRKSIRLYFESHPCVDCGETDYKVLEFDHIRGEKTSDVSTLINNALSWKRVADEIKKCDVRCANCHKRKTAKQFGWWKI